MAPDSTESKASRPSRARAGVWKCGAAYSSDVEGRLTARPGQILVWDDLGRLTAVKNASTQAVVAAYSYDALDRLLTTAPSYWTTTRRLSSPLSLSANRHPSHCEHLHHFVAVVVDDLHGDLAG